MGAPEFTDPRLAHLYDEVCNPRADLAFYTILAGNTPLRILDLCCGTGQLATALAALGHSVTGVDAAAAMLAVARERPYGDQVIWVEADARTAVLAGRFDLIVLAGHAFQAFLSDADVYALLCMARTALSPGGRLAFETRNPLVRAWEHWTPAASRQRISLADESVVEVHSRLLHVRAGSVDVASHYRFAATDEELVSRQVLRFPTRSEVAHQLVASGFSPEVWYGDWDGTRFSDQSPEIIVVAR